MPNNPQFEAIKSRYLVPFDGTFRLEGSDCTPPKGSRDDKSLKKKLAKLTEELDKLQRIFYAHDHHALLLIFQAMDAAGKDSTIRAVLSGVNPAGCQVFSFKQPTAEELDHDFLWRTAKCLPERGRIGVFNRSYYEEVLAVRVHPEYLEKQRIADRSDDKSLWQERFESIINHEQHLASNGTVILKFWLNVSRDEQKNRFISRLDEPEKNWKFSTADVRERGFWDQYMMAYQDALAHTSRPWAPWYAIPADNKPYMQVTVAELVVDTLKSLDLKYPKTNGAEKERFDEMRKLLESE